VSAEVELRVLEGSEFQTVGAAMLKPWEAKVEWSGVWPIASTAVHSVLKVRSK